MTDNRCQLTVNGQPFDWRGDNLRALLLEQGIDPDGKGFAVAVNGSVVPRQDWPSTALATGDKIEIVSMYKGG